MPTSTDNPADGASRRFECPHRPLEDRALLERYGRDCPLDLSVWCANRILQSIRRLEGSCSARDFDYHEKLHARFRRIVEGALSSVWSRRLYPPGVQVIWATTEKPKLAEMPRPPHGSNPGSQIINEVIFELNRECHAHYLLAPLSQLTVGRSHIFSIRRTSTGATLVCRRMGDGVAAAIDPALWSLNISLQTQRRASVDSLCEELGELAADSELTDRATIADHIREYIDACATSVAWPEHEFNKHLVTTVDHTLADAVDWPTMFREAVRHIALITLYQARNQFTAMDYILAPTLKGESESSLVIYWPDGAGDSPLHLLCLLQMIVGQNATAILAKERKLHDLAENVYSIGHPLKHRLGDVQSGIDTELEALSPDTQWDATRSRWEYLRIIARKATCTAETMDLMADLCRCGGDVSRVDAKFLSPVDYRLGAALTAIVNDFTKAGYPVSLENADLRAVASARIRPISVGGRRLFDAFYEDLIYELMLNPVKRVPSSQAHMRIRLEALPLDAKTASMTGLGLTFANPTREPHTRIENLGLTVDHWNPWPIDKNGPKGGLRLLATQLRVTGTGDLYACPMRENDHLWFKIGVRLEGLQES